MGEEGFAEGPTNCLWRDAGRGILLACLIKILRKSASAKDYENAYVLRSKKRVGPNGTGDGVRTDTAIRVGLERHANARTNAKCAEILQAPDAAWISITAT